MAEEEVNIISHLLEVEQNAYLQAKTAQDDANKMLSEAKTKADSEYKAQYDVLVSELEKDYKDRAERIAAEYKKNIDDYKNSVEKTEQDKPAFNAFVKKVIEAL